jgi:hypothetical protein
MKTKTPIPYCQTGPLFSSGMPDCLKWNRMVLAALAKVALAATHPPVNKQILNLAIKHRLIYANGILQSAEEILVEYRRHPERIGEALELLGQEFSSLEPDFGAQLKAKLHAAALALALSSEPPKSGLLIEETESAALDFLLRLGGAPIQSECPPPEHGRASKSEAARWAAGWTETIAEEAFRMFSTLHEHLSVERTKGAGTLDGIARLDEIPDTFQAPVCDGPVLIYPPSWQDRRIWLVGDLHGEIDTLEQFLEHAGWDGAGFRDDAACLFLGDLGDRGQGTLAVWLRVAELKAAAPSRVHLLRGNHEETIKANMTRADDGTKLQATWNLPTTTNHEAYTMLSMAMECNQENVALLFDAMPDIAILPASTLAVHGCLPPRFHPRDGNTMSAARRKKFLIRSVADLRNPLLGHLFRWTDFRDGRGTELGWQGLRNTADMDDLDHWRETLGDFTMVHGHIHPHEGSHWSGDGKVLGLKTCRILSTHRHVARLDNGTLTPDALP